MVRRIGVVIAFAATSLFGASQGGPIPVPLPLFPANNWWNADVSNAPVDLNSANFISHINTDPNTMMTVIRRVHPDWGGNIDVDNCSVYGFPYIIVDGSQPLKTVTFDPGAADESDGNGVPFYPIPDEAITQCGWIEQGPPGNQAIGGDRHMLIVDKTHNWLFELYNVFNDGSSWSAYSGAKFDMNTNDRRTEGWTSADASGMAMLPGLVRYDEVYGPNEITHAFRFTVRDTNGHFFPASHTAGGSMGALPMGGRLRLKSTTSMTGYSPEVQKIMRALMKYGLIVADNGSDMYIQGNDDNTWNMDIFNSTSTGLAKLTASDFEVVQQGWKPSFNFVLTMPSVMGSGDTADGTLTVYDSNYNLATGYTGTVHFTSTDGSATLPANYTFIPGDNGSHTFPAGFILRTLGGQTIYATDIADSTITCSRNVIVGPNAPTNLTATASSSTNVNLSWTPSTGGTLQYEILRLSSSSPAYATVTTISTTSYSDTVTAGEEYVYKVRAIDISMRFSPFSVPDAATTVTLNDDPLSAGITPVKALHITDLRQAANLLRAAAGLSAFTFADGSLAGIAIKPTHVVELRTAISQARSTLGLPAVTFTDPSLSAGTTLIKAGHVQELRNAVK